MPNRFHVTSVDKPGRYALGHDAQSDSKFLAIPVANRMVDYEEYYRLSDAEYATFTADEAAALAFADRCRRRANDERLILKPGSDRGTAI
jgi:hypothetical protein